MLLFSIKFFTWKIKEKYFEIFHFQNTRKKREEKFQRRKKCESKCASVFFQILEKLVNVVCCECVGPKVMFLYTFHVYFAHTCARISCISIIFFDKQEEDTKINCSAVNIIWILCIAFFGNETFSIILNKNHILGNINMFMLYGEKNHFSCLGIESKYTAFLLFEFYFFFRLIFMKKSGLKIVFLCFLKFLHFFGFSFEI